MVKIGILFKVPREFFITTGPCQPTYLHSRPRRTDSPAFKGREIMHKINYSTKILTAAVLCSLLNATPVWAASKTTTSTVEQSNTSDTPYSKITVDSHRIFQSMSRKGNCHDNSVMENFFGIMKQEMYYGCAYYSYDSLKTAIEKYIKYYNEQRIKKSLGWMSPIEYRLSLQVS